MVMKPCTMDNVQCVYIHPQAILAPPALPLIFGKTSNPQLTNPLIRNNSSPRMTCSSCSWLCLCASRNPSSFLTYLSSFLTPISSSLIPIPPFSHVDSYLLSTGLGGLGIVGRGGLGREWRKSCEEEECSLGVEGWRGGGLVAGGWWGQIGNAFGYRLLSSGKWGA